MKRQYTRRASRFVAGFVLLLATSSNSLTAQGAGAVPNKDRSLLPRLKVDQEKHGDRVFTMVRIAVPTIPGFECDVWCYEDRLRQGEGLPQEDGSLVLRHKTRGQDGLVHVTTHFVPRPGELDFIVTVKGKSRRDVRSVRSVNACWQLRRTPGFQRQGDFVKTFVNQCFIYTVKGFTLLRDTTRFPDTRRPASDRTNSPPWVQVYPPIWARHRGQPKAFWGASTDRPVYSIIGEVSRDGKWLAALAWPECHSMCQGWHDCLHNGPKLLNGYDEKTNQTVYRGKFYFMENDPQKLLERYTNDLAAPEEILSVEPRKRGLVVTSSQLPNHEVELYLPDVIPLTNPPQPRWQRQWWGTWTRRGFGGACPYAAWVRAYRDHVNVYLSLYNHKAKPIEAHVTAFVRFLGWTTGPTPYAASKDGEWLAAFTWEQKGLQHLGPRGSAGEGPRLRLEPGETKTVRGRLYFLAASPKRLANLHRGHQAEWQKAVPFRLPLPPDTRPRP